MAAEKLKFIEIYKDKVPNGFTETLKFHYMVVMFSGEMVYCVDGEKYTIRDGEAIYMRPNQVRSREDHRTGSHYATMNIMIPSGSMYNINTKFSVSHMGLIYPLLQRMREEFYADMECEGQMLKSMLRLFLLECEDMCVKANYNPYVEKIKRYISDNSYKQINLSDISDYIGLSQSYVSALFRGHTGVSVGKYIDRERLKAVNALMINTTMSLVEIASEAGFSGPYYFSRWFYKMTGERPSVYRKKLITAPPRF